MGAQRGTDFARLLPVRIENVYGLQKMEGQQRTTKGGKPTPKHGLQSRTGIYGKSIARATPVEVAVTE